MYDFFFPSALLRSSRVHVSISLRRRRDFLRSVSHISHDVCLSPPSSSERNLMMSSPGVSTLTNVLPCNFGNVRFRDALSPPVKDHRVHYSHLFEEGKRTCHPWRDVGYGSVESIPSSDREERTWTRNGVQIRYFPTISVTILTKASSSLCQSDETHRIEHILKYITVFFFQSLLLRSWYLAATSSSRNIESHTTFFW